MKTRLAFAPIALLLGVAVRINPVSAQGVDKQFEENMTRYLDTEKGRESIGKAMEKYVREGQQRAAEAEMENMYKNPVKIDPGGSPVKGPAAAKITIIEFSDFQCPFCKRGKETMDQVLKAYPNDVKLVFKNMPLPFHDKAKPAAAAALAAGKQGKFWEFHDKLFENQGSLSKEFYEKTASSLGLNLEQFKKDFEAPEIEKSIKEDADLGSKNGIQGTPGFFVNGVAVKGAYPFDHFKKIIDRLLAQPAAK